MRIRKAHYYFLLLIICMGSYKLAAQQLVYTPINPSFGGSSFNGSYLLSVAQAENKFTAPSSSSYNPYNTDPLTQFTNNLNSQILNQLSSKIISSIFGEGTITQGHYEFGNYIIDINPSSDGIHINIQDNSSGAQTSVIVPFY